MNTYAYVGGNPLIYTDSYGLNFGTAAEGAAWGGTVGGVPGAVIGGVVGFGAGAWATNQFWDWYYNESTDGEGSQCPVPGKPGEADGYKPPKNPPRNADKNGRVKNPNGDGKGWLDHRGDVWVPTGGKAAHGGEHWDVQGPRRNGGGRGPHRNVYPGGHVR